MHRREILSAGRLLPSRTNGGKARITADDYGCTDRDDREGSKGAILRIARVVRVRGPSRLPVKSNRAKTGSKTGSKINRGSTGSKPG